MDKSTDNNIYFFGYGSYRDPQKLIKLLGKMPVLYSGSIIEGYKLSYQNLNQIPKQVSKILNSVWGQNFRSYTINQQGGIVSGIVWKITPNDLEIIKEWEFDGIWREFITINAKCANGETVIALTDKAINSSQNLGSYDGLNYPNNLNGIKNITTDTEQQLEDVYRIEKLKELRVQLYL
jgi:hypothetical protein